jgi:hypothetical protein
MANEKISELPSGSPAQPGDAIPIARSGNNFSISAMDIANLAVGFGAFQAAGNTAGTTSLVSSGTLFLAGGNNVTLSQNGNSVTISANTAAAATLSVSAGSTSGALGGITFGNGSNVSFGLNNGTLTASVLAQSAQTQASGNIAGTGVTTATQAGSTLGITHNTAGISLAIPPWITTAATAGGIGVTLGGNTSGALALVSTGTLFLAGGSNITLSQNGNSVTISGATAAGLTTGGVFLQGNTTGQSSSSTYQLTSLNVSGAGIISAGWSASTLIISAPGSTGISQSMFAVSNTTLGTSGTQTIGQLTLAGAGGVSVGVSNGSYVISGATGGAGGGVAIAASNSTFTSGTVVFSALGALTISNGPQSAVFSVPNTSSLSATGWASVSVNGSTISVGAAAPQLSFYQPLGAVQDSTVTQQGNGTVQVYPAIAAFPFTASRVDIMVSISITNLAVSTEAQALSMYVGLYSLNGSTLSLASSGSQSYQWSNSSGNSNNSISGMRRFSAPINVNYTGGFDLFVGMMSNTTFSNIAGVTMSNVVVPLGPGPQLQGLIGQVPANSMQFVPGQGIFSASSAGLPSSMALSAISGAGSGGNAVDNYSPVQFVNVTA